MSSSSAVTSDMSAELRAVLLLGPQARPPIGGLYHPNARQRQAAELGARRQRVHRLMKVHEARKTLDLKARELERERTALHAMEEGVGEDALRTLAQYRSPAVPAMLMLHRKRRLIQADAAADTCSMEAARAAKRRRAKVHDDVTRARRRLNDDSLGVRLRHQRLAELEDEERTRHRVEAISPPHFQGVIAELKKVQQRAAAAAATAAATAATAAASVNVEVTAPSSESGGGRESRGAPRLRHTKFLLVDEDVSPMEVAWQSKPGYEPSTPTDLIPSPLFMRGPRGVPGATPDRLCRSPAALCRSPSAR